MTRPLSHTVLTFVLGLVTALVTGLGGGLGGAGAAHAAEEPDWGTVSGTLVDRGGRALPGIEVSATSGGSTYRDDAAVDPQGRWVLDLPVGTYEITFTPDDAAWLATTITAIVRADQTTVVTPAVVLPRTGASIDGLVRTKGGGVLPGAEVALVELLGDGPAYDGYEVVAQTTSDALGSYQFSGFVVGGGNTYTVGATAAGHRTGYLGGATDPLAGTALTSQAAPALDLVAAPQARGTVTALLANGQTAPLGGVDVQLHRWDAVRREFMLKGQSVTRSNGGWSITLGEPGSYTLFFDTSGVPDLAESGWLGGTPPTSATSPGVFVTDSRADAVRDHRLSPPLTASGTVRATDGRPLSGVGVTAYVWDGAFFSETGVEATTGGDGAFSLRVPRDNWVTFGFTAPGEPMVYLGGGPELPSTAEAPHSVWVSSGALRLGNVVDGVATMPPPTPTPPPGPSPTPAPTPAPVPTPPTPGPTPTVPAPGPTPAPPVVRASVKVSASGSARVARSATWKVRVKLAASAGGNVAGRLELRKGGKVVARVTVPAGREQTVKVSVRGKKLARLANRRGVVTLVALFAGNATTAPAQSAKVSVRVG